MPKITKGTRRHFSNASSRTRRRIIQLQYENGHSAINSYHSINISNTQLSSNVTDTPILSNKISMQTSPVNRNNNNNTIHNNSFSEPDISNNLTSDLLQYFPLHTNTNENNHTNLNEITNIEIDLKNWAVNCKIPHCHLNALLIILKKYKGFEKLPKDSRTLLKTPNIPSDQIRLISPNGKYFHFGITDSLLMLYANVEVIPNKIELVIGIDGLPIARSSNSQFWLILAYVKPSNYYDKKNIFPIGLFWGNSKPTDSNEYLLDFINEMKGLLTNGLVINNINVCITIFAFCCDDPAKFFFN